MAMLRARLYELELQKREAAVDAMNATKTDIGWGHQIRSYVLQPYQMVKDLRTGVETGNPSARCSTATSTASWPPRWRSASKAPTPIRAGNKVAGGTPAVRHMTCAASDRGRLARIAVRCRRHSSAAYSSGAKVGAARLRLCR